MTLAMSRRISFSRSGSSPCALRIQPLATYCNLSPEAMMTPNPVTRRPGSMPRMRRMVKRIAPYGGVARSCVLDDRGRIDILDVVDGLERIEQLLHSGRLVAAEIDFRCRLHRHLGERGFELRLCQSVLYENEIIRCRDDLDRAVIVTDHVIGTCFQRYTNQLVLIGPGREDKLAAMPEQKRDRAVGPAIAAGLGERVAHVGDRSNAIVGEAVDDHRGAVDTIAFIAYFVVVDAFELAGAALGGAIDGVLRHVVGRRLVHRESQPRVGRDIAAAELGRDRDLADEAGEDLAALGVGRSLLVLDVRPLAVAGHDGNGSMKMSGIIAP